MQMKNLAYIPNKLDKAHIEPLFIEPICKKTAQNPLDSQEETYNNARQLSNAQLQALLKRLTKITKKQYEIQQQTAHILQQNKQLRQKRLAGQKVENRLLAKGKQREKKIMLKGQELQRQRQTAYYRDTPQISEKGHKVVQQAIDRRLEQLISNKQNKKEELRHKYEPTFRPVIDTHSDFINDIENLGDLFNRMNAKQKDAQKRKQSFIKKIVQDEKQDLTFKPKINQKSIQIAAQLPPRQVPGTPLERQSPSKRSQESFPFAPTINKNTDKLLQNCSRDQDCFRRLYKQAKQLSVKNQSKIKERDRTISFTPSLNQKSLKIASSRRRKQQLIQCGKSSPSQKDETVEFFEEVRVGAESELERNRTYSLRGSKVSRMTWVQESQNHDSKDIKDTILKKLRMMK